jgi:two-component system, CitB family, response regulator DctR
VSAAAQRTMPRPVAPWRVLVVEDDAMVAALHCRLIDALPEFRTVGVASNGEAAYRAIEVVRPDLAIVDLTMPGGDGLTLLHRVRQEGLPLEVVVVTASRDAATIREAMHLGVIDYLVKPFAPERLRQSFNAFALRSRALTRQLLAQDDVDLVQSTGAVRIQRLPKGLKRSTLRAVREALEQSEVPLSAEEVGQRIGVARVTARRYLEYLDVIGVTRVERECHGPGRPRNRYHHIPARPPR